MARYGGLVLKVLFGKRWHGDYKTENANPKAEVQTLNHEEWQIEDSTLSQRNVRYTSIAPPSSHRDLCGSRPRRLYLLGLLVGTLLAGEHRLEARID